MADTDELIVLRRYEQRLPSRLKTMLKTMHAMQYIKL
jgi:hypothetical protein